MKKKIEKSKYMLPLFTLGMEIAVIAAEIFRELHSFRVIRYRILSDKWKRAKGGCRIVFLSDLHNRSYGKKNDRLYDAIRRQKPDVIFIGGDMLVGKNGCDYRTAAELIGSLPKLCPVYYANGNHEQRMKEDSQTFGKAYERYKSELLKTGVCFLENESAVISCKGIPVRVTGLEIPKTGYARIYKKRPDAETIRECVGGCEKQYYQILLAHNPSYMDSYFEWGADLVLSGHLHGGVVRIPGFRGMVSPGFELFPKYSGGYHRKGGQAAVISRGLGSHTIPIRLFNSAELVVLEF